MGITTVLSTDSVRHLARRPPPRSGPAVCHSLLFLPLSAVTRHEASATPASCIALAETHGWHGRAQMRGFQSRDEAPILHASTYEAGAFMPPVPVDGASPDPEAVAAAERKRVGALFGPNDSFARSEGGSDCQFALLCAWLGACGGVESTERVLSVQRYSHMGASCTPPPTRSARVQNPVRPHRLAPVPAPVQPRGRKRVGGAFLAFTPSHTRSKQNTRPWTVRLSPCVCPQIVEGVHLSPRVVLALMQKIPVAVPFLVVIRRAQGWGDSSRRTLVALCASAACASRHACGGLRARCRLCAAPALLPAAIRRDPSLAADRASLTPLPPERGSPHRFAQQRSEAPGALRSARQAHVAQP